LSTNKNLLILGEISMQKVKVQRYVSGKIPDYARNVSSDESSGDEDFIEKGKNRKNKRDEELLQHPEKER
jgi:microfibrillar-associated protein 1